MSSTCKPAISTSTTLNQTMPLRFFASSRTLYSLENTLPSKLWPKAWVDIFRRWMFPHTWVGKWDRLHRALCALHVPYSLRRVCWFFNVPHIFYYMCKGLWDGAYGLSSLSEKTRKSNRLQMLLQMQHFLLSYFKTLSVGPAEVWTYGLPLSDAYSIELTWRRYRLADRR